MTLNPRYCTLRILTAVQYSFPSHRQNYSKQVLLNHITSVLLMMTKYFYHFSVRKIYFSKTENLYDIGSIPAAGYSETYSLMFWKNIFGHIFFSACYFKCIFKLKSFISISGIGSSILLIIKSIVTEISDIIVTLTKIAKFSGFLNYRNNSMESGSFLLLSVFTFFCFFYFAVGNSGSLNYIHLYQTSIKSSVEHSRCFLPLCNMHFSSCSLLVFMSSFSQ